MFSSVQLLSSVQCFVTPWTTAHQTSLSITNSRSPHKPMSIESVMPSNHLILCHPLLLLPSIFPSVRVFSNESALHITWPNVGDVKEDSSIPGLRRSLEEGMATYSSILFVCFFYLFIYFNCRITTLKYCDGFCHTSVQISTIYNS